MQGWQPAVGECPGCGAVDKLIYRPRHGDGLLCRRCKPEPDVDHAAKVRDGIAQLRTGLSATEIDRVASVFGTAVAQRELNWILQDTPGVFRGEIAHRSAVSVRLAELLVAAGADNVRLPQCPLCLRTVKLGSQIDGLRCCHTCWVTTSAVAPALVAVASVTLSIITVPASASVTVVSSMIRSIMSRVHGAVVWTSSTTMTAKRSSAGAATRHPPRSAARADVLAHAPAPGRESRSAAPARPNSAHPNPVRYAATSAPCTPGLTPVSRCVTRAHEVGNRARGAAKRWGSRRGLPGSGRCARPACNVNPPISPTVCNAAPMDGRTTVGCARPAPVPVSSANCSPRTAN